MRKRLISLVIVLCMLISELPAQVMAAYLPEHERGALLAANTLSTPKAQSPFLDVGADQWFYEAAQYVYENKLFSGTSGTAFSPQGSMTRAMFVTVLGRMAQIDVSAYADKAAFSDVSKDAYYAPYAAWAAKAGIAYGVGEGNFAPDMLINRAQMAALMVRYMDSSGIALTAETMPTVPADFNDIPEYAREPVLRLWRSGFFKGDSNGRFNPSDNASRAEAATLSMRLDRHLVQAGAKKPITPPVVPLPSVPPAAQELGHTMYYTLSFETNGGSQIENKIWSSKADLLGLPIPFKQNAIFSGWCYDTALKKPVSTTDRPTGNTTLYAKYQTTALLEDETPHFASALDQDTDYTITVLTAGALTAEEVKAGITAKNFNQQQQTDFITVTGGNGQFTVSGGVNGFEPGATYKLTLTNDALTFKGYEASVRDFNFTTAKEETLNLTLNSGLTYIPIEDTSNITENGLKVAALNAPLAMVGENAVASVAGKAEGTFEYDGLLSVGETVAIYEGVSPQERTLATDNEGDVAYVTITAVNGKTYSYKSAEEKDVLFTPDVLPMPADADKDGDANNHSLAVNASVLDYSGDIYANIGLDSQTVVEKGDFLAFYSGEFGEDGAEDISYGKITSITEDTSGTYIIAYADASEDEILTSMDVYNTEDVSGDTLLEGADKVAIEKSVEKQVRESGFAEEAARYLAALALETDSFTKLDEDFDLTEYTIKKSDGTMLSKGDLELMEGAPPATVTVTNIHPELSSKLEHFNGMPGLRLALELGVKVVVNISDNEQIVIEIVGTFEEEVHLKLNISGGADWKKWGGIYYIEDIGINANVDLYNYTGISIQATLVTRSKELSVGGWVDNNDLKNISDEIKKLVEQKNSNIAIGNETMDQYLSRKYSEMIEKNSDWVELFSQELFKTKGPVDPFNIICYEINANFVIKADLNISLGCEFYYENAKRYNYHLQLFSRQATSDTINLKEESYGLKFYAMGTIGLKAGVNLNMKVGIFDTELNSIGLSAEVGVYTRLYGYFYYQLAYTASKGRTSQSAGALFFELGIYLEIGFEAQALKGKISYSPTLYENEWPLWTAGVQENVLDFGYKDSPQFSMKRKVHELQVPWSYFGMKYLDLKTGYLGIKGYDDATQFKIEMTNPAFAYNPANNILSVTPGSTRSQDGEMIVTWISAPAAFTSAPITRRMKLHWDDYSNEYSISFNTYGGSVVPIITAKPGGPVVKPEKPTRPGYDFVGWFSDSDLTKPYTFPAVMPDFDTMVYVKWTVSNNTPYTVEHYKQELNGTYTLAETGKFKGTTGVSTTPEPKNYVGFNTPDEQRLLIWPDGSSIVRYYYTRAEYTVTFSLGAVGSEKTKTKLKYGALITAPVFNAKGYVFTGWDTELATTMPARDLTYTALWEPASGTAYRVEHYVEQQEIDKFIPTDEPDNLQAKTESVLSAMSLVNSNLLVENGIAFSKITVNGKTVPNATVTGDGKLVVKVYYKRLSNTLTFKLRNGQADIVSEVRYGAPVNAPKNLARVGYNFAGWDLNMVSTMPAGSLTYTAQWTERNDTAYKVRHYQQNAGDNGYTLYETDNLTGTTDTPAVATAKNYPNFSINTQATGYKATGNINGDGSEVLSLYYDRAVFTVTFEKVSEQAVLNEDREATYKFAAQVTLPVPTRTGYTFDGWYLAGGNEFNRIMPAADTTVYAKWTAQEVSYTVEHYVMGVGGDYQYTTSDSKSGLADNILALGSLKKASLETANGIVYHHAEIGGNTVTNTPILPDGTLLVKLYYERKQYPLNWNLGSGTATNAYTNGLIYYGANITAPQLIRSGYSYTWDSAPVGTMPANVLTYTALWTAQEVGYTVEHYVMGLDGNYQYTASDSKTGFTDYVLTLGSLKKPSLETANGIVYHHAEVGGNTVTSASILPDGTLTVKLYYERKQYPLNWNLGGGTATNTYTNGLTYYGANITVPQLIRSGYSYTWDSAPMGTMPANALTYTAVWTAGGYTVKFNANGGSGTMANQTFDYDAAKVLTTNAFTRSNYIFVKWNTMENGLGTDYADGQSVKNLTSDGSTVNLYAQWQPYLSDYTVCFYANLGCGEMPPQVLSCNQLHPLSANSFTRQYYTFIKWNTMANGSGIDYSDGESVVNLTSGGGTVNLYAQWQIIQYDITYYLNGGVNGEGNPAKYTSENTIALSDPTRTGFTFMGWYTDSEYTTPAGAPAIAAGSTGNRSFYAKWWAAANNYGVVFNANGGSGEMSSQSLTCNEEQALSLNTFTPPNAAYIFGGWATSADGEKLYNDGQIVSNLAYEGIVNLYAKWTPVAYSITYVLNGGSFAGHNPTSYTIESDTINLDVASWDGSGHAFFGWYSDEALTMWAENIPKGSTGDKTFYAKWTVLGAFKGTNNENNTFNIARTSNMDLAHHENTAVILHGANRVTITDAKTPATPMYDRNVATASGRWPLSALDRAEGKLGAGVRIALIDTGISTKAIASEHLADGKNYINPGAGTEDRLSHGTAVAGILSGSDEKGIEGIAPAATLVPLVYYTSNEDSVIKGDNELLARIIRDAVDVYGCRVINISSGTTEDNEELKAAVAYAEEHGALVVSSVGNDNNEYPDRLYYPAAYETVLGVAALRQDGEVASFSQRNTSVALCAPGDELRVLRKGGTTAKAFGTSYAAAYVSGAAAVLLAEHPELTPSRVRGILCASALDIGKPGYDLESGWGAVQIDASLKWAAAGPALSR